MLDNVNPGFFCKWHFQTPFVLCGLPLFPILERERAFPPFLAAIASFAGVKVRPAIFASLIIGVFHFVPVLSNAKVAANLYIAFCIPWAASTASRRSIMSVLSVNFAPY